MLKYYKQIITLFTIGFACISFIFSPNLETDIVLTLICLIALWFSYKK
jgi:hypothetical protein